MAYYWDRKTKLKKTRLNEKNERVPLYSYRFVYKDGYDEKGNPITKKTKSVHAVNDREAKKLLLEWASQIESGDYVRNKNISFHAFVDLWHKEYLVHNIRDTTIATYMNRVELHIMPVLQHRKINDIKTTELQRLINNATRKDGKSGELSAESKLYIYNVLSSIFKIAKQWDYINKNPMEGVNRPKQQRKKEEFIDLDDLRKIIAALVHAPQKHRLMIEIALWLGLRRGEVLGLEWDCIDFEAERLEVRQNWTSGRLGAPKSDTGYRTVPVPPSLLADLQEHRKNWRREQLENGHRKNFIFCGVDGDPLDEDAVSSWLRRFLKRNDLPKITYQDLRKMYTVMSIRQGATAKEVQQYLGYSDVKTTLTFYDRVLESTKKGTAAKLDNFRLSMQASSE
jgi:integrase